jgi:hypothetical protein
MHRLEAVAHVRQGTSHDHAHGVIQVGLFHLVFEIDWQDFFGEFVHSAGSNLSLSSRGSGKTVKSA